MIFYTYSKPRKEVEMTKELKCIFKEFMESMKQKDEVAGAWDYGLVIHKLSDEYANADIVINTNGLFN